jgi:long-chain acyl-CoA synthetase
MNLYSLLEDWALDDDVLVYEGDVECTKSSLVERAERIASLIRSSSLRPGSAVAVMLPNSVDLVASLFAVWQANDVYVPVNPRLTDTEVHRILDQVEPVLVITTSELRYRAGPRAVLILGGDTSDLVEGSVGEKRFEEEVALVQYTSGTTGAPKAVLLTHTGVNQLIDGVLVSLRGSSTKPTSGQKRKPNIIPMSLSLWAGIYNVLFALRTDAPVVLMDGFDPLTFAGLVARFEIRSSVLPPATIAALASDERIKDLFPLRYVRSVTAPLSPLQARRFNERFGITVLNGYGQTEIGGEIVGWSAEDSRIFGDSKLGAVGRPHPGVEIRSVEPNGELWVRTPALSAGYLDGSDFGDRIDQDGWFRTGDIGRIDDDGFVWIEGRVSDMINRGGLKVYPEEVEEVLCLSPAVTEAAVVGVPDERLGEVPVAFFVSAYPDVDAGDLETHCRGHLAPYKVPIRFTRVTVLPRNEVGKLLRSMLVEDPDVPDAPTGL